jgi:hypothetical protein
MYRPSDNVVAHLGRHKPRSPKLSTTLEQGTPDPGSTPLARPGSRTG